jgi:hypothetical protein
MGIMSGRSSFPFWNEKSVGDYRSVTGKSSKKLVFILHLVNFYDSCTGFAGIKLILPTGIACPAPAENALPELRYRVGRRAEIAHILGEAMRIL